MQHDAEEKKIHETNSFYQTAYVNHTSLEEKKNHGTNYFPFECYSARSGEESFLVTYHWHEQTEFIFVERGEVVLMVDGNTYTGKADDIFFINPGQMHQLVLEKKDTQYFSFVFAMDWLDFRDTDYVQNAILNPLKTDMGFPLHLHPDHPCHSQLKKEFLSLRQIYIMQPDNYRLMTKILLYKIILVLASNQLFIPMASRKSLNHSQSAIRVKELMEYVAQHYQEHITLEQAAGIMHMSPKYFSSFFTKTFLISFVQYVNHYRIDQACILLKTTDMPVIEIALEVGFDNFSYFIRKFKEIRGYTPKEYRKKMAPVIALPIPPKAEHSSSETENIPMLSDI